MSTTHSQDATEQSLERNLVAGEIRIKGAERLHDVHEATQYLFMHVSETPAVTVTSTEQTTVKEVNPPIAQHIVSAVSEVAPVQAETPAAPKPVDMTNLEALSEAAKDLATPAQVAENGYGIDA